MTTQPNPKQYHVPTHPDFSNYVVKCARVGRIIAFGKVNEAQRMRLC